MWTTGDHLMTPITRSPDCLRYESSPFCNALILVILIFSNTNPPTHSRSYTRAHYFAVSVPSGPSRGSTAFLKVLKPLQCGKELEPSGDIKPVIKLPMDNQRWCFELRRKKMW